MTWYKTGSVSVTNGSTAISGSGTAWRQQVRQGDIFRGPDRETYEILSVNSDTSITLAESYQGPTLSGQAYSIIPTQGHVRALTEAVQTLLSELDTNMLSPAAIPMAVSDLFSVNQAGAERSVRFDDLQGEIIARPQTFNVKDKKYGAVGNGIADDTAAIQAAINDAQAVKGRVEFPWGNYSHTGLSITGNVTLSGWEAPSCRLITRSGSNANAITITQGPGIVQNPTIQHLTIECNRSGNPLAGHGIFLPDSAILDATLFYGFSVNLDDVFVLNARDACLYVGRNRNMGDVRNSEFKRGARCVYIEGSSDWRFFHGRFAFPLAGNAIHVNTGSDNAFIGGSAFGALAPHFCVLLESPGSQPVKLIGMTVNFNEAGGVHIRGPAGVARQHGHILIGNWFDQNSRAGDGLHPHIRIENSAGGTLIGNTFRHVGGGIRSNYLVEFAGASAPYEWVGNGFDAIVNIPYSIGVTNRPQDLRVSSMTGLIEGNLSVGGQISNGSLLAALNPAGGNGVRVNGASAGLPPSIVPFGADPNIALRISSFGSSSIDFFTGGVGVRGLRVLHNAGGVNNLYVIPGTSGQPGVVGVGSTVDTDADLALAPLGPNGRVRFGTYTPLGTEQIVGSIMINDSGGNPRKLAVIA